MTHDPTQSEHGPFGPLPKGVTEGDLLDWVEQRLPESRAAVVEAAIRTDRRLARQLEEMRVDRAAVAGLVDTKAPAALLDAVEQALERRMLVGLATGEPVSDQPPVSIVRPNRAGSFSFPSVRGDAVGRRLALAAGLLLLVGGASLLGVLAMRLTATSTFTPIAANSGGPTPAAPTDLPAAPGASAVPEHAVEVATSTNPAENEPGQSVAAIDQAPAPSLMTLARAVDLARQGRLIIRVRSDDLDRSLLRLGRMTREPRNSWRLGEDASPEVVASLQVDQPRMVDPSMDPLSVAWFDIPGEGMPMFPFPTLVLPQIEPERVIPTVFLGAVRPDEASLRGMLRALEETSFHSAAFEESPQPIVTPGPALNADAVLWWAQDPSGWTTWAGVPVVVTTRK